MKVQWEVWEHVPFVVQRGAENPPHNTTPLLGHGVVALAHIALATQVTWQAHAWCEDSTPLVCVGGEGGEGREEEAEYLLNSNAPIRNNHFQLLGLRRKS